MSKSARKKTDQIVVYSSEAEFFCALENRLKKNGYVLLETSPRSCSESKSKKIESREP